jgi:hypothetical protein
MKSQDIENTSSFVINKEIRNCPINKYPKEQYLIILQEQNINNIDNKGRKENMGPRKSASTSKEVTAVKATKVTKATTKKVAAAAKGGKKKGAKETKPLLPFKNSKYCFADFKVEELAAKIIKCGGSMTYIARSEPIMSSV